ncbi:hemerythrin domain-containing protein [Ramlibacter sp.]|uniref:hemerythrin domain-containing protein n=1 Tax=Ramlibacter sp. TaxID=1917967 RepID=UPI0035AF8064
MTTPATATDANPIDGFHRCHIGLITQLEACSRLAELADAAMLARRMARDALKLFDDAVMPHHAEEESELFPAVLRSARPEEQATVRELVDKLVAEHRDVEAQWMLLRPAVKKVAKGEDAAIDGPGLAELVRRYHRHARTEEDIFLPLAERILGRDGNHMAALGMSLHMRHVHAMPGYI